MKQRKAIFHKARYSVIEASTKSGKTWGCMAWLAEKAHGGKEGQNYWWVSPVFAQSRIPFRRYKRMLPEGQYTYNESELTITSPRGSVMWFKGGDNPDSLYGEDVFAAVIDEATRVKEESWHAVRSTLTATQGPIRIVGNVKGRKNWAYRLARKAEAGAPNMHYARITAADAIAAGVLAQAEVTDAEEQLPEAVFRELYMAEPSDDEGNPFGMVSIRMCVEPLSLAPVVRWGWDLAKSTDWTVGVGLDAANRTAALERFQMPWEETFARIAQRTGGLPAMVDSTGVGDPIVERLKKIPGNRFEGFVFTSKSKQQLMEGLAVAIQHGQVSYPEGVIPDELEEFEYRYTRTGVQYSAPEGLNDDSVCALALAVKAASIGKTQAF